MNDPVLDDNNYPEVALIYEVIFTHLQCISLLRDETIFSVSEKLLIGKTEILRHCC